MVNKLIIANGDEADAVYALGFRLNSPCIILVKENSKTKETIALIPELEIAKAKRLAKKTKIQVQSFKETAKQLKIKGTLSDLIIAFLKKHRVKKLIMSPKTRAKNYKLLIDNKFKVELKEVFPNRRTKSKEEIKKIIEVSKVANKAMNHALSILKKSIVNKNDELVFKQKNNKKIKVSSEFLRKEITLVFEENNCAAKEIIVSHGKLQTSCPHDEGSGIIINDELVVIDMFPFSKKHGYFFDMTRTYCKNPSIEQKNLYDTVKKVQLQALKMVKPGIDASKIHKFVDEEFKKLGYPTKGEEGFIHALGHGLGLEIHEFPRVGPQKSVLKKNDVITIEPGLYYSKLGGVRIEDTVIVTSNGCKNLSTVVKKLN